MFKQESAQRLTRWCRRIAFITVAVLSLASAVAYARLADVNGLIHDDHRKSTVITRESGPVETQTRRGPVGSLQGQPRKITTFSGTQLALIACDNVTATAPFHTVPFTKATTASRLRIGYSDVAFVRTGGGESNNFPWVEVKVDDASITPTPIRMQFVYQDLYQAGTALEYSRQFTLFGYAEGIASGPHTLTVRYHFDTSSGIRKCYRGNPFLPPRVDPFQIEIEEIP